MVGKAGDVAKQTATKANEIDADAVKNGATGAPMNRDLKATETNFSIATVTTRWQVSIAASVWSYSPPPCTKDFHTQHPPESLDTLSPGPSDVYRAIHITNQQKQKKNPRTPAHGCIGVGPFCSLTAILAFDLAPVIQRRGSWLLSRRTATARAAHFSRLPTVDVVEREGVVFAPHGPERTAGQAVPITPQPANARCAP
jgi:hypothetical protein